MMKYLSSSIGSVFEESTMKNVDAGCSEAMLVLSYQPI